jgi:hypothetical protein
VEKLVLGGAAEYDLQKACNAREGEDVNVQGARNPREE